MIRWRLYKIVSAYLDFSWKQEVRYNESEYVSWLAAGGPNSPIFDRMVLREKEVKEEIDIKMDILKHIKFLSKDYNDFMVGELLGI